MKTLFRCLTLHLTLVSALLLCGSCIVNKDTETGGPAIRPVENLVYLDNLMQNWIPCQAISAEQLPSGHTRVHARFANKHDYTAQCQIKVRYLDKTGQILDETSWIPLLLPRSQGTEFENTSLVTGVGDFTVLLREAAN